MSRTAVIVDAVRSPMGKGKAPKDGQPGGALSSLHPVELLGQVLKALFERNDVDPGEVEDVIAGCVSQVGEQSGPVGRWAWLAAGLPEHVPSVAVHFPSRRDQFCRDSLRHQSGGVSGGHRGTERVLADPRGEHRDPAHRLDAACHHDVVDTGDHALGREVRRLLA